MKVTTLDSGVRNNQIKKIRDEKDKGSHFTCQLKYALRGLGIAIEIHSFS